MIQVSWSALRLSDSVSKHGLSFWRCSSGMTRGLPYLARNHAYKEPFFHFWENSWGNLEKKFPRLFRPPTIREKKSSGDFTCRFLYSNKEKNGLLYPGFQCVCLLFTLGGKRRSGRGFVMSAFLTMSGNHLQGNGAYCWNSERILEASPLQ